MPSETSERPNFLIITTDQHNPTCFGYAGHPVVRTPNIDALARSGIVFSRAYVPNPVCMPTRASLFTGLAPSGHGVRMNGIPLGRQVPTMTQALLDAGYGTHCVGKIHLSPTNLPNGLSPDDVDPMEYPEAMALWKSGRIKDMPLPYFGLETVDFVAGHGPSSWGQYLHWLDREHRDKARLFYDMVALERTPLEQHLAPYQIDGPVGNVRRR